MLPKNIVSDGHGPWTTESEVSPSMKSTDGSSDATLSIDDSSSYTDSEPDYTKVELHGIPSPGSLTCPACGYRPFYCAESPASGGNAGMDALEELRLLNDQIRDISRVCNAVAAGDLTQKITVPAQGDLMVQLKPLTQWWTT
ncbi:hypothetical protein K438DRAFT_1193054 [Mycena galopus ATCC 62051]|nr:hypothetical protein K438DRAFT_1193054 [Mycena galopus ATCC 62051]